MSLDESIETLAQDAARRPEMAPVYIEFLQTLGDAAMQASPEQRMMIRALTRERLTPAQITTRVRQIMGWD